MLGKEVEQAAVRLEALLKRAGANVLSVLAAKVAS